MPESFEKLFGSDFHRMAMELAEIQQKLIEAGLFDHSRELLSCGGCGLMEDITFEGRLITCERQTPGIDTGLTFVSNEESGKWICPACGEISVEELPE